VVRHKFEISTCLPCVRISKRSNAASVRVMSTCAPDTPSLEKKFRPWHTFGGVRKRWSRTHQNRGAPISRTCFISWTTTDLCFPKVIRGLEPQELRTPGGSMKSRVVSREAIPMERSQCLIPIHCSSPRMVLKPVHFTAPVLGSTKDKKAKESIRQLE
jgi:hypothetical protein